MYIKFSVFKSLYILETTCGLSLRHLTTLLEYLDGVDRYSELSPVDIMVVVLVGQNWWTPTTVFCFHGIGLLGIISESS